MPEQFKVQNVTAINGETGESVPFEISIKDSSLIIDGKKLLQNNSFYGKNYIFTITGSYEKGELTSFKPVPSAPDYINIPNVADLIVSNVDETDRILKSNEANAPILIPKGEISVRYLDEDNNELAPRQNIEGVIGTPYNEKPISILGYKYKQLSSNSVPASGVFTNSKENIEFIYKKSIPGDDVTVRYLNTLGEKIAEDVVLSGDIDEEFHTDQKDIPGYTFKEVDGDTTGKFTNQPQTITYTYTANVLRFYDVPSELSFNETKISSKTETIFRKNSNWKIIVEDTRLNKNNWRVTAQLEEQFKDYKGNPLADNILLYRKGPQTDQWITSDSEVTVFDGQSTENDELYDVSWKNTEGPLIQVAPGTVKVGKYIGIINWKLIDAPA